MIFFMAVLVAFSLVLFIAAWLVPAFLLVGRGWVGNVLGGAWLLLGLATMIYIAFGVETGVWA